MYEQKTIVADSPEELDKQINRLFKKDYFFVAPPTFNGNKYMQTVIKAIGNH